MKASIGARWTPEHVIRRDTGLGVYEEINPRIDSETESLVQRAMTFQTRSRSGFLRRLRRGVTQWVKS